MKRSPFYCRAKKALALWRPSPKSVKLEGMKRQAVIFKPDKGSLIRAIISVPFLVFALFAVLKAKTFLQKQNDRSGSERKARPLFDLKGKPDSAAPGLTPRRPQKRP